MTNQRWTNLKKRRFFLLAILFFSFSAFAKNVSNGIVNFKLAHENEKIIRLSGDWEFYKDQTFSKLSNSHLKVDFIQVPKNWTRIPNELKKSPFGCGTYRVLISGLLPNTEYGIFSRSSPALAARIFANGNEVASYGIFSRREVNYKPIQRPLLTTFFSNENGLIELVIQVANFDQQTGGILSPIMFGLAPDIEDLYETSALLLAAIVGMLLFILFVIFWVWIFDKSHVQELYLSIFLLALFLRLAMGQFNVLAILAGDINHNLQMKLQNLILLSFGFFSLVYNTDENFKALHPSIDKAISFIDFFLATLLLCLPTKILPYIISTSLLVSALFFFYSFWRMIFALKTKSTDIAIYAFFYIVTFAGIFLDEFFDGPHKNMLFNFTEISAVILIWSIVIYFALSLEFLARNYLRQKSALSEQYTSYRKFVPSELTHILGKETFGEINLDDHAEIESTIMVIRFSVIPPKEMQISLREQFETIAFYSSKILEVLENSGGAVLYASGIVMTVLFRKNTKTAISTALEIQGLLQVMNSRRAQDYYPCIDFAIAVHFGNILLGVIGEEQRIDCTTISPNIELANNICKLGYHEKISVTISESAANNLDETQIKMLRPLGKIKFREADRPINLYGLRSSHETENSETIETPRTITQHEADKFIDIYN